MNNKSSPKSNKKHLNINNSENNSSNLVFQVTNWHQKAAENDHEAAQNNPALSYERGIKIEKILKWIFIHIKKQLKIVMKLLKIILVV